MRMSRQMGWDGAGRGAGDEGDERWERAACHWYMHRAGKSLVLSSSPEPVPKSHAPTVLNKHTERRGENGKRRPRQETVTLIWTPIFKSP